MKKVALTKFYGGTNRNFTEEAFLCPFVTLKCFDNPSSRVLGKYLDWGGGGGVICQMISTEHEFVL